LRPFTWKGKNVTFGNPTTRGPTKDLSEENAGVVGFAECFAGGHERLLEASPLRGVVREPKGGLESPLRAQAAVAMGGGARIGHFVREAGWVSEAFCHEGLGDGLDAEGRHEGD